MCNKKATANLSIGPLPWSVCVLLCLMLSVTGCANDSHKDDSPGGDDFEDDAFVEDHAANVDPWEPMNRGIYAFNDFADRWVLLPVATGYQWVTPDPVETGVSNFYANLFEIRNFVNDLLQLKFVQAFAS